MRGRTLSNLRRLLPVALCLGSLAMVGCPKMPRISPNTPTPTPDTSATPGEPTPTPEPEPTPDPTPNDQPAVLTQAVGTAPSGIAADASGGLAFVTVAGDVVQLTLSPPATASLKFDTHSFPAPGGIALNGTGTVAWFTDGSKIREYTRAPRSLASYEFGGAPSRLALDGQNNVWVMDAASGASRIGAIPAGSNPASAPLAKDLTATPVDLLVDVSGTPWVLCSQNGGVRLLSVSPTKSGNTLTGLELAVDVAVSGLNEAYGIAVDAPGALWITGKTPTGEGKLLKRDRTSGDPLDAIDLPFIPGRLAIRGNFAWIAGDSQIHKVSLTSRTVVDSLPTGGKAAEVFKDPQQDLWLPITSGGSIVKLDF